MLGEFLLLNPEEVIPLHGTIRDVSPLVEDMLENGWIGRPILVIDTGDEYVAWSGSHRIIAAIEAGFELIPCYVMPESVILSATKNEISAMNGHVMDSDRLKVMRLLRDDDGIALMRQEL